MYYICFCIAYSFCFCTPIFLYSVDLFLYNVGHLFLDSVDLCFVQYRVSVSVQCAASDLVQLMAPVSVQSRDPYLYSLLQCSASISVHCRAISVKCRTSVSVQCKPMFFLHLRDSISVQCRDSVSVQFRASVSVQCGVFFLNNVDLTPLQTPSPS